MPAPGPVPDDPIPGPPDAARLHNLNLNLLVALDAVLRERNVSAAARSLGLTQPTVSASLSRLRVHFDDKLLVRRGNRMVLTAVAAQLVEPVQHAVVAVGRVFSRQPDVVEPGRLTREFRVVTSDYGSTFAVAPVSARMTLAAPLSRLVIQTVTSRDIAQIEETLRSVDGMVIPHGIIAGFPHVDLFEDTWVAITGRDQFDDPFAPTMEELGRAEWVATYDDPVASVPAVRHLNLLGLQPRAVVTAPSFAETVAFITGTDRVGIVQERLARRYAAAWDLRVVRLPIEPVPITQALWWHPVHERDAEHRWFRSQFAGDA